MIRLLSKLEGVGARVQKRDLLSLVLEEGLEKLRTFRTLCQSGQVERTKEAKPIIWF